MKQRSLVLVTVDCLRADHVGFLGYARPTTPFLDSLARSSFVFSTAIVAGAPTYFSFPAIMASRPPLGLGRDVLGIAPQEPTLASSLHAAGYATAAFLAANPYLSPRFGYNQGFEIFRDFLSTGLPSDDFENHQAPSLGSLTRLNRFVRSTSRHHRLASAAYDELYFHYCQWRSSRRNLTMDQMRRYPAADVVVDHARSWLSSLGDRPFFLWLHLMDPHHPYYPPEEALSAIGCRHIDARRAGFLNSYWSRADVGPTRLSRYRAEVISLYDAGICWVDNQISRLVETLEHFHRREDTVLALTADHGEEFLEHGERYHSPVRLADSLIKVPLLIRAPDTRGGHLNRPFSLLHLAPTLLQILDIPRPPAFQGRGLWDRIGGYAELQSEPAIVECIDSCNNPFHRQDLLGPRLLAVRTASHKLVISFRNKTDWLYDLNNDPAEKSPLSPGTSEAERKRLLQIAQRRLSRSGSHWDSDLRLRALVRDFRQRAALARSQAAD
jgi:arylsulfatase A-like enzyme